VGKNTPRRFRVSLEKKIYLFFYNRKPWKIDNGDDRQPEIAIFPAQTGSYYPKGDAGNAGLENSAPRQN